MNLNFSYLTPIWRIKKNNKNEKMSFRPSPISKDAIKGRKMIQLGKRDGDKCIVRFGLNDIDMKKTWRHISVYPPSEDIAALKEFDLENDGLNNIVKVDENDREYIVVKLRTNKTTCKQNGEKMKIQELARDDCCVIVGRPEAWKFEGTSGVTLKAMLLIVFEEDLAEIEIN